MVNLKILNNAIKENCTIRNAQENLKLLEEINQKEKEFKVFIEGVLK